MERRNKILFQLPMENVYPEKACVLPKYFPGDIILTKDGEVGIIREAEVTINGTPIEWNNLLPENIEHGQVPKYSLDAIPGFPEPNRLAWWEANEWDLVSKGLLHQILKNPS